MLPRFYRNDLKVPRATPLYLSVNFYRLSKVLQSIYNQSGGYLHDDLKDLARSIYLQVNLLKKPKRGKIELSVSHTFSEAAEPTRAQTGNTSASEKEIESLFTLDLAEVYDAFLMTFEGYFEKAKEFVDRVKSVISPFTRTISNLCYRML